MNEIASEDSVRDAYLDGAWDMRDRAAAIALANGKGTMATEIYELPLDPQTHQIRAADSCAFVRELRADRARLQSELNGMRRSRDTWQAKYEKFTQAEGLKPLRAQRDDLLRALKDVLRYLPLLPIPTAAAANAAIQRAEALPDTFRYTPEKR